MSRYVDGFVLPIPKDRISDYATIAKSAAAIWKDHGALDYWECVGDDLHSECSRNFTEVAKAGEDETVVFAWAVFESREARDKANEEIMADPRMAELIDPDDPLFNFSRMAHGGFRELTGG